MSDKTQAIIAIVSIIPILFVIALLLNKFANHIDKIFSNPEVEKSQNKFKNNKDRG